MLSAYDFGGWEQGAVGEDSAQSADGCWHAVSSGVLDIDSVSGETSGASASSHKDSFPLDQYW